MRGDGPGFNRSPLLLSSSPRQDIQLSCAVLSHRLSYVPTQLNQRSFTTKNLLNYYQLNLLVSDPDPNLGNNGSSMPKSVDKPALSLLRFCLLSFLPPSLPAYASASAAP